MLLFVCLKYYIHIIVLMYICIDMTRSKSMCCRQIPVACPETHIYKGDHLSNQVELFSTHDSSSCASDGSLQSKSGHVYLVIFVPMTQ